MTDIFISYSQKDKSNAAAMAAALEQAGLTVQVNQVQAWRGQPLSDGTRLAPMNPILALKGTKS